ncbi:ABC transporter ATP-binding protein [Rhodoferax aquaticus]|uniref:ABC transporter ATP-binding protein n=1 Tax=Rhodoferax aquaticus TaxID=2527691 RepID=A0A515EP46_9BURK|nr:dipeptide ABC transporter ATP-binding protein [Rhodoferax aquaticus]QDL54395.1 ABC transporter ATP-binding protein [Rhodoferax aquaticus]
MMLLSVDNLRVSFAGHAVVNGVSFNIKPGEKLALVGESGSGKTMCAMSLLGLAQGASVSGHAWFETDSGRADLLAMPPQKMQAIRGKDIAMVFQEPMSALNPLFTIGEQIAEVLELKMGLSPMEAAQAAIDLIADTGIANPSHRVNAYPHQLSGGQRQRAMIAMALAARPKLLLADEPTTALDVTVRRQILDLLGSLQVKYNMAVLLITHDLHLVRSFADRVAVMEQGRIVEQGVVADVFTKPQHAYTRRLLASAPSRDIQPIQLSAPVLVSAAGLRVSYPVATPGLRGWFAKAVFTAVEGASFSLAAGQTLGIVGESGSGKTSLALAVLGLHPSEGNLRLWGRGWGQAKSVDLALRKDIQVVFQDPFSSLSPRLTIGEIVGEGLLIHAPSLSAAQRQSEVLQTLAEVGMTDAQFPGLLQRYPHQFSGGQRQRIAIARALVVAPKLLVLDEPTSALDMTMAQQVLGLLQRLQHGRGLAYLLITHDVAVVRAMAHDVIVMRDGRVLEQGPADQVFHRPTQEYTQILLAATQ